MVVKNGDLPWDRIRKKSPTKTNKDFLVGGFNPFEKY